MVNDMKKIDRRGFTLVELLAVIILLSIIMGFGSYAVIGIINNTKEKSYQQLVGEIKNAVEVYYLECVEPPKDNTGNFLVNCPNKGENGFYNISLGDLVTYGYLKGNGTDSNDKTILVNPKDNVNISSCEINYKYDGENVMVNAVDGETNESCPTSY